MPSLVEIGPVVLEIRWKCEKFTTTTTTTTTDNGQILIRKANLSLRLRWAKNQSFDVKNCTYLIQKIELLASDKGFSDVNKYGASFKYFEVFSDIKKEHYWYQYFEFLIPKKKFLISKNWFFDIKESFSDIKNSNFYIQKSIFDIKKELWIYYMYIKIDIFYSNK